LLKTRTETDHNSFAISTKRILQQLG